jgi:hypothetical protein
MVFADVICIFTKPGQAAQLSFSPVMVPVPLAATG